MIDKHGFVRCTECEKRIPARRRGINPEKRKNHFCSRNCYTEFRRREWWDK